MLNPRLVSYVPGMDKARIAHLIRERRKVLGKDEGTAASEADMSKGNWSHIEVMRTSPPLDTLEKMAKALRAHWVVRLVAGDVALDVERQELIDTLDRDLDQLKDDEVRNLLNQLSFYAAERARRKSTAR